MIEILVIAMVVVLYVALTGTALYCRDKSLEAQAEILRHIRDSKKAKAPK